jgi:hypothetical protein
MGFEPMATGLEVRRSILAELRALIAFGRRGTKAAGIDPPVSEPQHSV